MFKILQRRFLREVILYFTVCVLIFELIFLLGNVLQLVRKGIDFYHALPIMPYILPYSLPYVLPISLMAGITLVIGRMRIDNEILIVKSSGLHLFYLIFPLLVFSLVLSVASYFLQAEFIPYCYEQMKVKIKNNLHAHFMKGKGINRQFKVGEIKVYCDHYEKGRFRGLVILTREKDRWLKVVAETGRARVVGENKQIMLTLYNVSLIDLESPEHFLDTERISFLVSLAMGSWEREDFFTSRELRERIDKIEKILANPPDHISAQMLKEHKKNYYQSHGSIYSRYAMGLACFTLSLIAVFGSFAFRYTHRLLPLVVSLFVAGLIYFGPFFAGRILAEKFIVPFSVGYFLPHLVALPIGSFLMWRTIRT